MKRLQHRARGLRTIHAAYMASVSAVFLMSVRHAAATNPTFQSGSTFTITHDPDDGAATTNKTASGTIPSSGSIPSPSSYEYGLKTISNTGGSAVGGGPQSSASGSVGATTTAQNLGFTFGSGSGITQFDPGSNFVGDSTLKFAVNGTWTINSTLGPTVYAAIAFTLGNAIPSGDTGAITYSLTYKNASTNAVLGTLSDTKNFTSSTTPVPYPYSKTVSLGSLPSGMQLNVSGSITLKASDPGATISMGGDGIKTDAAHQVFFDMDGATPATWQYSEFANSAQISAFNLSDDTVWTDEMNTGKTVPNGVGDRAKFIGTQLGEAKVAGIAQETMLGMVDVDDPNLNFQAAAGGGLTFATVGGDGVFWVRNLHEHDPVVNAAGHTVDSPVHLATDLQIINDAPGPLKFIQPIDENGGPHGLVKDGLGPLDLEAPNSFTGGIVLDAGVTNADVDGSLGAGSVVLAGGLLNINSNQPFSGPGGTVHVAGSGQLTVNGTPTSTNFDVQNLGCLTGSDNFITSLDMLTNTTLANGAMIGHTNVGGGPLTTSVIPQNLALSALKNYTYGLSTDVAHVTGTVAVGDGVTNGWGGFGGDKFARTFGSIGDAGQLQINGNAHLDSLGSELVINVPVTSGGGLPSAITKRGAGLVAIENPNNTFTGALGVESGPISLDGNWNGSSIQVGTAAFAASLYGTGHLASSVLVGSHGSLDPGPLVDQTGASTGVATFADDPTSLDGPGTLHTHTLTLLSGAQVNFNVDNPSVPSSNDFVDITGDLHLAGELNPIAGSDYDPSHTYPLMTVTNGSITGSMILDPGFIADYAQSDDPHDPSYNLGLFVQGNTLYLGPLVPEPGTALLAVGAITTTLMRRRSRK